MPKLRTIHEALIVVVAAVMAMVPLSACSQSTQQIITTDNVSSVEADTSNVQDGTNTSSASSPNDTMLKSNRCAVKRVSATMGKFTERGITSATDAIASLEDAKDRLGIDDPQTEFVEKSTKTNAGITYYKLQQVYRGIPVYGAEITVNVNAEGAITGTTGCYYDELSLDTGSVLPQESFNERYNNPNSKEKAKLWVYCSEDEAVLAYQVYESADSSESSFHDAVTGDFIAVATTSGVCVEE